MRKRFSLLTAILIAGTLAACASEPEDTVPLGDAAGDAAQLPSEEVRAELQAGNDAYRAGNHQVALEHYTKATEMAPELAAAWFGVSMAQQALGNDEAAQEAMNRTMELAPAGEGEQLQTMPRDSTHAGVVPPTGMPPASMPRDSVHGTTGG